MNFKKPFNKKDGEDRVCIHCGNQFHTMKARHVCKPCVNKQSRIKRNEGNTDALGYVEVRGRKKPDIEGMHYEERLKEWAKKRKWMQKNLKERYQWQEYFRNEFERISNDKKLWDSINRDTLGMTGKKDELEEVKIGRPTLEDKRWLTWEDFERDGWAMPEDN